ncbi:hypothetical protein [Cellulophaga sp. Hel_I_12]|uniref:hypothetical protein n=1 Tax=Cellulophaga sp. Hel_I_12 TaxID=1249972 RepID=UPI00069088AB|nr:hypothetical protein [Cellulophaga sp. Hel_I_12]
MSTEKNTAKKNLDKNELWYPWFVLTNHWKSDVEFYREDLRFLLHLMSTYAIWISKSENVKMVEELKNKLLHLKAITKNLITKISTYNLQLGYLVEGSFKMDAETIKTDHEHLATELVEFVKQFRKNRKEVFATSKYIINDEELTHILYS